jgi:ABC-2 type transport system permease protein
MAGNEAFVIAYRRGWRGGLRNMLRAELGKWFRTNMWWVQALIWIGVIDGILAGVLFSGEGMEAVEGAMFFSLFMGLFPAIAIIIIMQDAIVGEKESGTAEWVLSKPVSRSAFVLSKLFANLLGVLVSMVALPSLVAYILISFAGGELLDPLNFIGGLGVVYLNLVFYLTLTLMLGTFFNHRGPVIGIPLALAFGQQMIFGLLPFLTEVLPWTLVVPSGEIELPFAASLMRGVAPHSLNPFYSTLIWVVLFIVLSLWRFEKEEF